MEWVKAIRESQRLKSGGRRYLRKYGIRHDAEITQPFAKMGPETATRLMLIWLTLNAKDGYDVEIRIRVPEKQTMYKSKMCMRQGAIFVRQTQEAPELIDKLWHQRDNKVNYNTLTLEEIIRSVQRADLINSQHDEDSLLHELVCRETAAYCKNHFKWPCSTGITIENNEISLPMLR